MQLTEKPIELLKQAFAELMRHKLRSLLTMFGIGWGVCALALISASGDGFEQGQRENWKQLGDRIVMLFPGRTELQAGGRRAGRNIRLYQSDVEAIREQCPAVEIAAGEIKTWNVSVASQWNAGRFLVLGVDPDYLSLRTLPVGQGRNISWSDVENRSRVCVLGDSVRKQLFEERKDVIGEVVKINGYPYTIVGLMNEKNQNSSYDGWDNDKVMIPTPLVRSDCPAWSTIATEGRVQTIIYRPASVEEWKLAQEQVRSTLGRIHSFDPRDEAAVPMWDTIETAALFDDTFRALGLFLGAVALVTLSLGGIGVMNTMMTAVTERTAEIGLRKALGATRRRVLLEIMAEGIILALVSGACGMLLVAGMAAIVNSLPMPQFFSGLPIQKDLVLKVTLLLGAVALCSALPPAWRAARMTPVEALRYEK
jgi:putative ABC transport system permease protein